MCVCACVCVYVLYFPPRSREVKVSGAVTGAQKGTPFALKFPDTAAVYSVKAIVGRGYSLVPASTGSTIVPGSASLLRLDCSGSRSEIDTM